MLLFCEVGDENMFFEKVWKLLVDDIQYNMCQVLQHQSYQMNENDLWDHLLDTLGTLFNKRGSSINNFNLPKKSTITSVDSTNCLFDEELSYDTSNLLNESENMMSQLNNDQQHAFNCIINAVLSGKSGFFFVSGYGGTGKTFLWNTIITYLRAHKKIMLSVASSGVASLLLLGGRTAHSRFRIPCDDLDETTTCNIKRGTMLSDLIQAASLIIWDEALMTHIIAFESLDRTLRDILLSKLPFGGKVVVLGGDIRQTLPVIEGGSRSEIINSAIVNSSLWSHVVVLHLRTNMRLSTHALTEEGRNELAEFSKWILNIGEGNIEATTKEGESEPSWIKIPDELLLKPDGDKISCMVNVVYPYLRNKYMDFEYLRERAILTPTNDTSDKINNYIVSLVPDDEKQFLSSDTMLKGPNTRDSYDLLYPVEFLNSLSGNNFPQHKLCLKKGVPVMLLRNLNQAEGLCNGARLIITVLGDMIIEGEIMSGTHKGKSVLIPRISLTLKNNKWPFVLQRRQYPIKVCYSMTINKSQE
jgi:hypothetical protein